MITIVTPTYNRAHLLPRLRESLCAQTCKDFEWLVIDDGSTDGTEEMFENGNVDGNVDVEFPVRYIRKENGGKHTALNVGIMEATGDMILIVDSDDALLEDAVETVIEKYEEIKDDKSYCGVCGYMQHSDGTVIGSPLPHDEINASSLELRYKYGVTGDMIEVFRTDVLREFLFPEIKGERFCPEALVWNRIAAKYKMRVFNKCIYIRDYLDGGLTSKIVRIRCESPIASAITYQELTTYDVPLVVRLRAAINYWRFRLCGDASKMPRLRWWLNIMMPLGWLMHLRDRGNFQRERER